MSTHISSKLIFLLETATNTGFRKRVLFYFTRMQGMSSEAKTKMKAVI